jgi:hypothetical protein
MWELSRMGTDPGECSWKIDYNAPHEGCSGRM